MSLKGLTPELTASTACCEKKKKESVGEVKVRKRTATAATATTDHHDSHRQRIQGHDGVPADTASARVPPARTARVSTLTRLNVRTQTVVCCVSVATDCVTLRACECPDQPWEVTLPDEKGGAAMNKLGFCSQRNCIIALKCVTNEVLT